MSRFRAVSVSLSLLLAAGWASLAAGATGSVRLPLEYHHQERELSCEAAALTMVLHYYGIPIAESEVIRKMPFDPTARQGDVWGDPDLGFVGDIDGVMAETGYGIHWNAMARLASNWKKTLVLEDGSVADLVSQIDLRRPVIAWVQDGPGRKISWKTPQGRKIQALTKEHAQVVYGYRGDRKAPRGFYVMDPQHGPRFLKTRDFLANWEGFGRKGIVLYR